MEIVRLVHYGNTENRAGWQLLEQCRMATFKGYQWRFGQTSVVIQY